MEPKSSVPFSHEFTTDRCPEPHEFTPHFHVLFCMRSILILFSHLRRVLPRGLFTRGSSNIMFIHFYTMHATYPAHVILHNLIIKIIFVQDNSPNVKALLSPRPTFLTLKKLTGAHGVTLLSMYQPMSVCVSFCVVHLSVYNPHFFARSLMKSPWRQYVCAVGVVSKESRRFVLPRTFYAYFGFTLLYLCVTPKFFRFLCGPDRIKGKQPISSSQNFLRISRAHLVVFLFFLLIFFCFLCCPCRFKGK
jgi:hypothetical protein